MVAILCGAGVGLSAQTPGLDQKFEKAQAALAYRIDKIRAEHDAKRAQGPLSYRKALEALRATKRAEGDLEGYTAVQKELDRFGKEGELPLAGAGGPVPEMVLIQDQYRTAMAAIEKTECESIISLSKQFAAQLEQKKADYTREGRIEDAMLCKQALADLNNAPELALAQLRLTELSKRPGSEEEDADKTPQGGTDATEQNPTATRNPKELNGYAYHEGRVGPAIPGVHLKRESLRPVGRSGLTAAISATLELGKDDVRGKTGSKRYSSSSSYTSGAVNTHARVKLRPRRADAVVENARLCIQYFSRPASKGGGHIKPNEITRQAAPINYVDKMGLVVDCPAVGIRKTTYKYTRSTYDYRSGDTFYGAIVSVFGADGAIIRAQSVGIPVFSV